MEKNFLDTTVILPVQNVRETAKFYQNKLGFEVSLIWENPVYCSVRRGDVVIEFGEGRKEFAGSGVCFIHVDNADNIYNEFKSKDIEFVGDLSDRDYGSRDFRIKDNNGNMLIIGHALKNEKELLKKGNIA
jgi:catechol 2,3-dioxygenase-like lactoylglutathione lyase family enzyme